MPQSLSQMLVHIVFSTKNRVPYLRDERLRTELYAYVAAVLNAHDSPAWLIGGMEDHVHILCALSQSQTLSKVVGETKRNSSRWLKTKGIPDFYWQRGYGAFSVSFSNAPRVKEYINEQPKKHAHRTFQDEFRAFLKGHGLEYDERYVWD